MELDWKIFNEIEYNAMKENLLYKVRTKFGETHTVYLKNGRLMLNIPQSEQYIKLDDIEEYAVIGGCK